MQNKTIVASDIGNSKKHTDVRYRTDNICKRCGTSCSDLTINGFFSIDASDHYHVYLLEYCPACFGLSIAEYHACPGPYVDPLDLTNLRSEHFPVTVFLTKFDAHISKLSPSFVELYHQAEKSQQNGCADICGMGYRKALEFLVKDYLTHLDPDAQPEIAELPLGQAIRRIENRQVQILAKGSAWLGNDECHYVRKHTEHDVDDMKRFITALVNFIVSELTFEEAVALTSSEHT